MTDNERVWQARVEAWRTSGQTTAAFAKTGGFSASTLRNWLSRLGGAHPPRAPRHPRAPAPAAPQFVRVVPRPRVQDDALVVAVGEARITVRRGFPPALLREVVSALGEAR